MIVLTRHGFAAGGYFAPTAQGEFAIMRLAARRAFVSGAGGGAIVNNPSVVALVASTYPHTAYTAAKGGVPSMTREPAIVYARKSIRVNAVCPGPVNTTMVNAFIKEEANWETRRPYMPMGRIGTVEEVANLVAFLASDEASYITSAAYATNGGISRGLCHR